jgi:hypothetical protein
MMAQDSDVCVFPDKMLEFVSQCLYRATLHRVTKHRRSRLSLVFELRPLPGLPYRDMLDFILATCRAPAAERGIVVAADADVPLSGLLGARAGADPVQNSFVGEEGRCASPKAKKRKGNNCQSTDG